jgi:hypothetical protein
MGREIILPFRETIPVLREIIPYKGIFSLNTYWSGMQYFTKYM